MSSNEDLRQVEKYITVVEFTVDWKRARRAGLTDDEAYEIVNLTGAVFEELFEAELRRREMMKEETEKGDGTMKVGDRIRVVAINQKFFEHVLLPYEGSEIGRLGTVVAAGNDRAFPDTAWDVFLDGDDETGWWSECYLEVVENE